MFTGLIEAVGRIADVKDTSTGRRLRIAVPFAAELGAGDSVAVNGVCLTVTHCGNGEMYADVGPETARVTTLGAARAEQPVNLERALRAGARVGGHFVQGHVDGMGVVEDVREEGDARWITVTFPPPLASYFVQKGSVALDGISLTVAGLDQERFDVMIVPFTWAHTNLPSLRVGARVNLECDLLGKYVARSLEVFRNARSTP